MKTLVIQLTNKKAYRLLEELEALQLIKVLKRSVEPDKNLSDKFAGKLPKNVADKLHKYVNKSRDEWNSRSI